LRSKSILLVLRFPLSGLSPALFFVLLDLALLDLLFQRLAPCLGSLTLAL